MSDCRALDNQRLFVEEAIIGGVKRLLSGRVNEVLKETEFYLPLIEFGGYEGGSAVVPVISLSTCERTEKERIIQLDAYALTITFTLPETPESELCCYAYAAALDRALGEDPALGGVVSRAVLAGKKYIPPKKAHCGDGWEVVLSLRVTVEGGNNDY
ncbi:hypothetical protein AGMMS50293_28270 [Spirochaetia bacterium]|nr:hypothetical protein AGMMS50293_28270 [Spirochaetia bacterium]